MVIRRSEARSAPRRMGRLRAAVLSWLGVPVSLTDSDFWAQFGANSHSGQSVTDQSMLRLSTVWACARLISETIATLPLGLYERTSNDARVPAKNHPLYSIIHDQPNIDATSSVHWEATVAAMLLRGNARAEKLMVGERLVGIKFLVPRRLSPPQSINGAMVYPYVEPDGRRRIIPANRIFRIPGFTVDGVEGLSVVQYGANVFGNAQAADLAAGKMFENGMLPTTYFKLDRVLKPDQREEFRDQLRRIKGALNAGESPLLESGMGIGDVGINPNDAQLLESRGFSVEEICRWFRVPPWMVGHQGNGTKWGSGMEQEMIAFLAFTLMPWLRRIEQAINKDLLSPAERMRYYAEFSIEGLLRADSAARAAFYGSMVNNGIMTRDELRVKENLPPKGGNAAVLTVQSAMIPLDQIGQATKGDQARAWLAQMASQQQQTHQE